MSTALVRVLGFVLMSFAALGSSGCDESAVEPSSSTMVSGTVSYRERIALSENALVEVSLEDVSRPNTPAPVVAHTSFVAGGRQVPLPFAIVYDPTRIEPNRAYALRATIRDDGRILFTTDTVVRVVTQGYPSYADLMLVMVAGRAVHTGGDPRAYRQAAASTGSRIAAPSISAS